MSEFEELFQSIQNSVTVDVVRDSAIVLVNEGDAEHPLKAGEYYFDDEKNILYVGGYVPEKFYLWQFIKHDTSIRVIEPPRIKFSNLIPTMIITHNTSNKHKVAPRLFFNNTVSCTENIYHSMYDRVTNTLEYSLSNNVSAAVTHRTEVI